MNGKIGVTILGNGIQTAYIVALVNVVLQLVISFGVAITSEQEALIVTIVNLVCMIGARAIKLAHEVSNGG